MQSLDLWKTKFPLYLEWKSFCNENISIFDNLKNVHTYEICPKTLRKKENFFKVKTKWP